MGQQGESGGEGGGGPAFAPAQGQVGKKFFLCQLAHVIDIFFKKPFIF